MHNGIIENFEPLRARLQQQGYAFVTQTDTEVIAHLIHAHYDGDLLAAVRQGGRRVPRRLRDRRDDHARAGSRRRRAGRQSAAGRHRRATITSSPPTRARWRRSRRRVVYLEEGDIADIGREGYAIYDAAGVRVARDVVTVKTSGDAVELGPYSHFMQKEIFEQPRAIADTLESVGGIGPELFGAAAAGVFAGVNEVRVLACGTSYYSGMVGRLWLEAVAGIPAQAEIASEYRYRDSVPNPDALVVVISQSGETADTLVGAEARQGARPSAHAGDLQRRRRARWCGRPRLPI